MYFGYPETVNWSAILTAGLSTVVGSFLTILVTPSLQHYFWRRQQKAALKLKTIEAENMLTAQFIQQWIEADGKKQKYSPPLQWFEELSAVDGAVKALFKEETYTVFKQLEKRVDPELGTDISNAIINADVFIRARDAAVKALYSEVI